MRPQQFRAIRDLLSNQRANCSALWFTVTALLSNNPEATQSEDNYDAEQLVTTDPESLLVDVERAANMELTDFIRAKIIAAQSIYGTDLVYANCPLFVELANLTNAEDPPVPGVFNPANATECSIAILDIALIDTDQSPEQALSILLKFSPEIRAYWGAILASEGAVGPVPPLRTAIMPAIDPLGEPMMLEAINSRNDVYSRSLMREVWSRAKELFTQINSVSADRNSPILPADTMQRFMVSLVGDPPD